MYIYIYIHTYILYIYILVIYDALPMYCNAEYVVN